MRKIIMTYLGTTALALSLLFTLGACTSEGSALLSKAEDASDALLLSGEQIVCSRASVRAVAARYWKNETDARIWADFCGLSRSTAPVAPVANIVPLSQ